MGAFSVTSSEMTKRTTELRSKNQSLKKQITKLRDSKEALNSTWDGSAKKAFSSAVESDVSQMTNFSNLIEQYCSALDNLIMKLQKPQMQIQWLRESIKGRKIQICQI